MATRYVRSGASGANNGTDWTNAYTTFSGATLSRGDIIYIGTGSYAGRTCSTAPSSTTLITILGATIADHGTSTGWSDAFSVSAAEGGSQALFTSAISFQSAYWLFDSMVYPPTPAHSTARTKTAYGFRYANTANPFTVFNLSTAITTITICGVSATAPGTDIEKFFIGTNNETLEIDFLTMRHCFADGYSNTTWGTSDGLEMADWLHEYNLSMNGFSSVANHGEDLNNNYSDMVRWTIRWNWFEGRSSGTGTIVALNGDVTSYLIYGNVVVEQVSGDGCFTGVSNATQQELRGVIYHNTFVDCSGGGWIGTIVLSTVRNNLLYSQSAAIGAGTSSSLIQSTAYFSTTNTPSSGTEPTRYVATGDPFNDLAGNDLTLDTSLAIVTSMPDGATVGAPYNVDMFGNTGVTRGAFQLGGAPAEDGLALFLN